MAPMIRTYPTADTARQAVVELQAAGISAGQIRLLVSLEPRGTSRALRGGFAGPLEPDAQAGAFAGPPRRLSQARGSFATGSVKGDPDLQRKGSFADVERVAIVSYEEAAERSRVTGYRAIRLLLRRSGLDGDGVHRTVKVLHGGHSVVLVDPAGVRSSEPRTRLRRARKAA
jgi:hypothetical protein